MYRITNIKNYIGEDVKYLQVKDSDNWVTLTTINDKNYQKFLDRGLNPLNSDDVIKFRQYNNL